jgi:predicted DNA-binding protein YlxM (UPF0122 family)
MNNTIEQMIESAVNEAHASFPAHYDKADTRQELWLFHLEGGKNKEDMLKQAPGSYRNLLLKQAYKVLKKEDQLTYGFTEESLLTYSRAEVQAVLEIVFNDQDWTSFGASGDGQPRAKGQVNETGDIMARIADVRKAIESLPNQQKVTLFQRYALNYTVENIGDDAGISKQAASDRLKRAEKAIQRFLGGTPRSEARVRREDFSERPGTAKSMADIEKNY